MHTDLQQTQNYPTIDEIKFARKKIARFIVETPLLSFPSEFLPKELGDAEVFCKVELLQKTGSFKPRAALLSIMNIPDGAGEHGVVAASRGNHAIAVSYAANVLGVSAKVVMPRTASKFRQELCRFYGAEVLIAENINDVFSTVEKIQRQELRTVIHPYEGELVALGTSTIGLELHQQLNDMDAVVIPIGGGGLCGGIALALKQLQSPCKIYGVEPENANGMAQSFAARKPLRVDSTSSIADSLCIPHILPYSFDLCYRFVDEIVTVSDNDLRDAMRQYFYRCKLAVEPAGAASLAALYGPLKSHLRDKKIALIISGSNIDSSYYCDLLNR